MRQYIAFSGGKDSRALALLFPDAELIFTDTKWEHKKMYQAITDFEKRTGRHVTRIINKSYPGGIPQYIRESKFFPNHGARYCTRMFKIEPLNEYLANKTPCELLIALRSDEPEDDRIGNLTKMDGLTIRYPLRERGIDLHGVLKLCLDNNVLPRFPAYMAGGGCIGCFYKTKGQVISFVHQAPIAEVDEMQRLEEEIQDRRGRYFYAYGNAGLSVANIRNQPLLFSDDQVFAETAYSTSLMQRGCGAFCGK